MKSPAQNKKNDLFTEALFYLLVFASITCFAAVQAFGDPPDEINRFKVVSYICLHGRLPHGADPEIILDGYGASYAFQPILTYIMQGFLLRFINLFTEDSYVLLLAARLVNAVFGVLMAYFVRQTAKEIWKSRYLQWLFTIMVVFLPQNIFIHSYVNTDSMAMLSVSVICYALLRAQRTDYEKKDCILLATGIILCALSYYNAYGIILAAVLIFLSHYIHAGKIEWAPMLRKGLFISAIVLAGIGWWFIRNGILYDGDILALNARSECAMQTAIPELHPLTRVTFQNSGRSLSDMLFGAHYILLVSNSFIAMFGPLLIPTHRLIYVFYRFFWLLASSAALLIPGSLWFSGTDSPWNSRKESLSKSEKSRKAFSCGCMLLFCLITIGLAVFYSYSWDFQPQGRYILPILIPFMYLVARGVQKICGALQKVFLLAENSSLGKKSRFFTEKNGIALGRLLCLGIIAFILASFSYSLFITLWGYYSQNPNLFLLYDQNILNVF